MTVPSKNTFLMELTYSYIYINNNNNNNNHLHQTVDTLKDVMLSNLHQTVHTLLFENKCKNNHDLQDITK